MENVESIHEYEHEKYLVHGEYCTSCKLIPWGRLVSEAPYPSKVSGYRDPFPYVLLITFNDVRSSVREPKCPLCYMLWSRIVNSVIAVNKGTMDWNDGCVQISCDHHLSSEVSGRLTSIHPLSEEAIRSMKAWMKTCFDDHPMCKLHMASSIEASLPARLLAVGQSDSIYLVDVVAGQSLPQYAALSHCWGLEKSFTTTMVTLQERKSGMLVRDLPKTFQDAVTVTQTLELRFLWIDSLCIIQDCSDDWGRESVKMGSIYIGANVTIAASSDVEGFLQPRCIPVKNNYPIEDFGICLSKNVSVAPGDPMAAFEPTRGLFLVVKQEIGSIESHISRTPLSKRAWVIQERYLSSRTIFFARDRMYWACAQVTAAEEGKINTGLYSTTSNMHRILHSYDKLESTEFRHWYYLVSAFTGCTLTKSTDRLPALSGMAAHVANITGKKYYAGMWGDDLQAGLLWRATENLIAKGRPTWSWASISGQVKYPEAYDERFLGEVRGEIFLTIVDISVDVISDKNPFGGVTGGSINIRTPLLHIEEYFKREWAPDMRSTSWLSDDSYDSIIVGVPPSSEALYSWPRRVYLRAHFDTREKHKQYLYVAVFEIGYNSFLTGLLLSLEEDGQYNRVGTIFSQMRDENLEYSAPYTIGWTNSTNIGEKMRFVRLLPHITITIV